MAHDVLRPVLDEELLIEALTSGRNDGRRDPRELITVLAKSNKPIFIVDEKRFQSDDPRWVLFSLVCLPAQLAENALHELTAICDQYPGAARRSGPGLLHAEIPGAEALRDCLATYRDQAQVFRAGITDAGLRAWHQSVGRPPVVFGHRRIATKAVEYFLVRELANHCAGEVSISGLGLTVVDSSVQNGLDPSLLRTANNEIGVVAWNVPDSPCTMALYWSTPEERSMGALLRLPDIDCACAELENNFEDFKAKVFTATPEQPLVYWF